MIVNKAMRTSVLSFFKEIDNLKNVFKVLYSNETEIDIAIGNFYQSFFNDSLFRKYYDEMFERYGVSFLDVVFTRDNLVTLVKYLADNGLSIGQIRSVIIDNPGLIFMVYSLSRLHVVFKDEEFYGLIIFGDNDLYSYYYVSDNDDLTSRKMLNHDFSNDTYLVKKLHSFLCREDVKAVFDFDAGDSSVKRLIKIMENDNLTSGFKIR